MKTEIEFLESIVENCNCLITSALIHSRIYKLKTHQATTKFDIECLFECLKEAMKDNEK